MSDRPVYDVMTRRSILAAAAVGVLCCEAQAQPNPDPRALLTAVDRIRVPQQPFRVAVTLTDYVDGKPRDQITLLVYSKLDSASREFRTLVKYVKPPRDLGKVFLFNGTNLWFFDPNSKATVRISPQQRLIGQASNGDVVTTNLATDYGAKIVGNETIADSENTRRDCWRLNLSPSRPAAIYGRIELWVEATSSRPVKAKFYTDSDRLLKVAYYRRFQPVMGTARPTETIIIDALDSRAATILSSRNFEPQAIPDIWYQREYLPEVR